MRVLTSLATRGAILGNILDSMSSQVIVLDSDSRVILVNQAFLDFGRANGLAEPEDIVGASYLKACVAGARAGATESGSVGIGIQRVQMGQSPSFTTIYDCHSPMERRWFRVTITKWSEGNLGGVVAVHTDITADYLAQRAVLRAKGSAPPSEGVVSFTDISGPLYSLAETLTNVAGRQAIIDIDPELGVMVDVEMVLTVIARLTLDASKHGPVRLEGIRQGRRVVLRVGGWRDRIDEQLLDDQMADLGGRAIMEINGASTAPLVDIVLSRARPPKNPPPRDAPASP